MRKNPPAKAGRPAAPCNAGALAEFLKQSGRSRGMDSFEFNKIAGAFLGTLLFTMALGVFSDAVFSHTRPAKPGYDLPAAEEGAAEAGAAPAAVAPLPERLAKADPKKGEASAKACT